MYGIKAKYSYYVGTYGAPTDGFMRAGMELLKFNTIEEALDWLKWTYNDLELVSGKATYAPKGSYRLSHSEYARPRFTIVKLPSGMKGKKVTVKRK